MIQARTFLFLLWTVPAALALAAPPAFEEGPSVTLRRMGDNSTVDVKGLDPADLHRLADVDWDGRRWATLLSISVGGQGPGQPSVLGSYRVEAGVLRFEPRFPFVPGLRYRAVFQPDLLPGREGTDPAAGAVAIEFALPKPVAAVPTVVRQVYPSRSTLPENQLKFYLHFNAPMSQGGVYEFIHLLDADGKEIDGAFLKLDEELWDRDGLRLTLLIDPGRIKRDVGPREGFGPVLEAGKTYTLQIDARWPDAEGRQLKGPYRKTFRATSADVSSPDIQTWRFRSPVAGSASPLVVEAPEPLDHALFSRLVRVLGPDDRGVSGRVTVDEEETRWSFTPDQAWQSGNFQLVVDTALEDLAGNNLRGPFELDVFEPVGHRIEARVLSRPFEVRPGP